MVVVVVVVVLVVLAVAMNVLCREITFFHVRESMRLALFVK